MQSRIESKHSYSKILIEFNRWIPKLDSLILRTTIVDWFKKYGAHLEVFYLECIKKLKKAKFVHADETRLPRKGGNWWLWVNVTWSCMNKWGTWLKTKMVWYLLISGQKPTSRWMRMPTRACIISNNDVWSLEDNVPTRETTLLLWARQDPYGKWSELMIKPRKDTVVKCSDTPYQKVKLTVDDVWPSSSFHP